jgi:hypothetical protein
MRHAQIFFGLLIDLAQYAIIYYFSTHNYCFLKW